jgi:predicted  nucleic acid-binding Zn-ribbon protein
MFFFKETFVLSDDFGKDLQSVQNLQRKHDSVERDISVLQEKVENLRKDGARIQQDVPEGADQIEKRLADMIQAWDDLRTKVKFSFFKKKKNFLFPKFFLVR